MPGNPFINSDQHKLPFFSDSSADRVNAEDWVDRLLAARLAGEWSEATAIGNARLVLLGPAAEWHRALEYTNPAAETDLDEYCKEFRKTFDKKEKPEDINRILRELQQKSDEPVERFKTRCIVALLKQQQKLPEMTPVAQHPDPAVVAAMKDVQKAARKQVLDDNLFHYFLGGLRPTLRQMVIDKRVRTFAEAVDEALASETALESGKNVVEKSHPVMAATKHDGGADGGKPQQQGAKCGGSCGGEAAWVSRGGGFRGGNRRGGGRGGRGGGRGRGNPRPPWSNNNNNFRGGNGNRGRGGGRGGRRKLGPNQCALCKEEGHWQKECPNKPNAAFVKVHYKDGHFEVDDGGHSVGANGGPTVEQQVGAVQHFEQGPDARGGASLWPEPDLSAYFPYGYGPGWEKNQGNDQGNA